MGLTSERLLKEACRWAYEHHTREVDDNEFLPQIKSQGASDTEIERVKEELERTGRITNHRVIGGRPSDFELSPSVFRQYLQQALPAATLAKARALHERWNRSPTGTFSTAMLIEQLGVSETEASYYFDVLRGH